MTQANNDSDDRRNGQPLRLDPNATSADPEHPPFVSRPEGAPVYYGFPVLDDVEVDGFRLGMITDFIARPDDYGDAFVVAPDGSRCGLIWESEVEEPYFAESSGPEEGRWGVWSVGLRLPLTSTEEARAYLAALLAELRPRWEAWRRG
jgi:hypothetical protein